MERIDPVVIVGGGPAGLFLALKLGLQGLPVTVLEAEPGIVDSPRAIAYPPITQAALASVGVLADIQALGLIVRHAAVQDIERRSLLEIDFTLATEQAPHNHMLMLGQNQIAQVLRRHLERLPQVTLRWGHRVTAVSLLEDGVRVQWVAAGEHGDWHAPWLVGADGARSTVREQLGLGFEGITWPERFVATNIYYDFSAHGFPRGVYLSDPVDWAVIAQIDRTGLWRVCYGEAADISEDEVRARLPERFRRMLPGAPEPGCYRVQLCTPYRVHQRSAASYRSGRALLVADAAHITNPIGGLGLAGGIIDADQLGVALADVLRGRQPETALDAWAERRRRVFLDYVSPTATENKRRLSEKDPARRAKDAEMMALATHTPEIQRHMALESNRLAGDLPAPRA